LYKATITIDLDVLLYLAPLEMICIKFIALTIKESKLSMFSIILGTILTAGIDQKRRLYIPFVCSKFHQVQLMESWGYLNQSGDTFW